MAPTTTAKHTTTPEMFRNGVFIIQVGKETKEDFTVHRSIAGACSSYFEAALKEDGFKEGVEGIIHLKTEDAKVFEHLVCWMYTGKLPDQPTEGNNIDLLCELWLLADRYGVILLMNQALEGLSEEIYKTSSMPFAMMPKIYENTLAESGLRCFCIYAIGRTIPSSDIIKLDTAGWSREAERDLLRAVALRCGIMPREQLWASGLGSYLTAGTPVEGKKK
ncbi:hypothetical protein LTR56_001615 [Elasticomyces elasticus]|nr:hypothetical protein LTR56_001615 [Elasticomyces elasticus]KAK3667333.1 hypothetical protein LTR22_001849 [Elasticomyces elasticus]KAK4932587.1 hypothetical protein LTR49_001011 [Elasticomyces elasticus]KAK5769609.1 hypothetical protein LTS12_000059 [Elasticomyces elasticus]